LDLLLTHWIGYFRQVKTLVATIVCFAVVCATARADVPDPLQPDGIALPALGQRVAGGDNVEFEWVNHQARQSIDVYAQLMFTRNPDPNAPDWNLRSKRAHIVSDVFAEYGYWKMRMDSRFAVGTWYWSICGGFTDNGTCEFMVFPFAAAPTQVASINVTSRAPQELSNGLAKRETVRWIRRFYPRAADAAVSHCKEIALKTVSCDASWSSRHHRYKGRSTVMKSGLAPAKVTMKIISRRPAK
jgi:hypothetical protein